MKTLVLTLLLCNLGVARADSPPSPSEYMHLNTSCSLCSRLDRLLDDYSKTLSSRKKWDISVKVSDVIQKLAETKKAPSDIYTEIYFSINATAEVLNTDAYASTVVQLLDIRMKYTKEFDYVFWRFPLATQKLIAQHMKGLKEEVRPNAIPAVPKEVDF